MFFKKNKHEKPQAPGQQSSTPFEPSAQVSGSFSLFAPALNPTIEPIDFGFNTPESPPSYVVPATSPDSLSYAQPGQSYWNENESSPSEDFLTPTPSLENGASPDENSGLDWEIPASPSTGMNFTTPSAQSENPAYLGETFENYVPQSSSDTTAVSSAQTPVTEASDPSLFQFESSPPPGNPDFLKEMPPFMPSDPFGQSLQSDSLSASADLTTAFESSLPYGPEPSTGNAMGELMPWEQPMPVPENMALPDSPEALWQNLDSSDTLPGEQVPLAPGAMMDTLHQKIYPDDPFHTDPAEFLEGQQAFEDAAQFLFPDTMKAPLNWQEDSTAPIQYNQPVEFSRMAENAFEAFPMDLGPSIQSSSSSYSEITSLYPEAAQLSDLQSVTAPLSSNDSFDYSLDSIDDAFSSLEEVPLMPELEWPSFESLESLGSIEGDFINPALQDTLPEPEQNAFPGQDVTAELNSEGFDLNMVELSPLSDPDESVFTPFESEASNADFTSMDLMTADDGYETAVSFESPILPDTSVDFTMGSLETSASFQPESTAELNSEGFDLNMVELSPLSDPDESVFTPFESEAPNADFASMDLMTADDGYETAVSFESPILPDTSVDFTMGSLETSTSLQPESTETPQILSDQDFYATDFTLNERGELIPVSSGEDDPLIDLDIVSKALQPLQEVVSESVQPVYSEPDDVDFSSVEPLQQSDLSNVDFSEVMAPMDLDAMHVSVDDEDPLSPPQQQFFMQEAPSMTPSPFLAETSEDFTVFAPASQFSQTSLPPVLPVQPLEPLPETLIQSAESNPVPFPTPPIQQPQPSPEFLEGQRQSDMAADSPKINQPSPVNSPGNLLLGDLEVLGTCPLAADRRLLLVSSDGVFALMGQVGLEQPQISVLKIFENNPLAYQNTFTAVAEAQAATQGMFITQVGTWHAIVSTYQDKITLHTELG